MLIVCKFVQVDLSVVIKNWESHALINPSNHDFVSDDCHLTQYFPISTSNGCCLKLFYLYGLTSHYLGTYQAVETLLHLLMIMSKPHYLYVFSKYDQIYLPSHDSHHNPVPLFENSSLQLFQGFQEDCDEFYDLITEWLKKYYLAGPVENNKFQCFYVLAKEFSVVEDTFTRSFQGLLIDCFHKKAKSVNWLEVVVMAYLLLIGKTFKFCASYSCYYMFYCTFLYINFNFIYLCE